MEILAGKSPNMQSYTVCIYSSGQPYKTNPTRATLRGQPYEGFATRSPFTRSPSHTPPDAPPHPIQKTHLPR
jgi:hypothetical protein